MADYKPATLVQRVLFALEAAPTWVGRSAARKLSRRLKRRGEADFGAIVATLGPGDICLDLGANVGDVTLVLAATGAQVHAWEPDPEIHAILHDRTAHLPNVVTHQAAIGAVAGMVQLRRLADFASDPLMKSIGSSVVLETDRHAGGAVIDVPQHAFRDVLAGFDRPVRLVKMDIEGAELDILRDLFGSGGLRGFDALFCETHQHLRRSDMAEILRFRRQAAQFAVPDINLYWR